MTSNITRPALILALFGLGSLAAQTVQIDFGRSDNQAAGNWNNVHGPSGTTLSTPSVALIDNGGDPTGFTLNTSFASGGSWAGSGADWTGTKPAPFDTAPDEASEDSLFIRTPATTTLTFTGLTPGDVYKLEFFGARGNNGGATQFTVTDNTGALPVQSFDNYSNETAVATFTGLAPDISNEIKVVVTGVFSETGTGTSTAQKSSGALNAIILTGTPPPDDDNDGMPNAYETENGTDPNDDGTTGETSEGAKDGPEGALGDKDVDGLTNLQEYLGYNSSDVATGFGQTLSGTADSDGDDVNDGHEVDGTLNPWDEFGFPDGPPGLPTDPNDSDSDDDTLTDGDEINVHGTDPNYNDSDLDNLEDAYEIANGLDPTVGTGDDGADGDPDMDNLINSAELSLGTLPQDDDSDDDDLKDGEEVDTYGTDPLIADSDGDFLTDGDEVLVHSTNPLLIDSDVDGHRDNIELLASSDPNDEFSLPNYPTTSWSIEPLTAATQVINTGTLLYAQNVHGFEEVVNGVTFAETIVTNSAKASPEVQTMMSSETRDTGLYDDTISEISGLLESVWFNGGDPLKNNIAITGLTPGKTYVVQMGRADDRNFSNITGRWLFIDGLGGDTALDPVGSTNTIYGGPSNPTIIMTGTFTATSTVQGFNHGHNLSDGTYSGTQISFIQVREAEAPADFTISVLGFDAGAFQIQATGLDTATQYQLVRSANLADGFPTIVDGPRLPAGSSDIFEDSSPPTEQGFYRLEEILVTP